MSCIIRTTDPKAFSYSWELLEDKSHNYTIPGKIKTSLGGTRATHDIVEEVLSVELSEHELAYVLRHCENIPSVPNRKTLVYYGDMAKFIAANCLGD